MNRLTQFCICVCSALWETERSSGEKPYSTPCSIVYLALGMDFNAWEEVAAKLRKAKLCEVTTETVTLTDRGRQFAANVNNLE